MLERLKNFYSRQDQRRAVDLLHDPSCYPGLPALDSQTFVIQLYVLPSFEPLISWTLYRHPDASFTARRVRWDFIADHQMDRQGLTIQEPATWGSDAQCGTGLVAPALAELSSLHIPAFDPESSFGTDGVTYGFRRESFSQSLEFSWWCYPPKSCKPLAEWHHRFTGQLEAILPAHTDQFRLSAISP